jgi:2-polyprenyl-3-methyl-5-hydroxy-6-metoxy-1,4-benzoquinol methylase
MNPDTCAALLDLNRRFYAQFAGDFSRTRRSWPPGFSRILPYLQQAANVIDVGCGNGRLLAFLADAGWRGDYCGVDSSEALLAVAAEQPAEKAGITSRFRRAELTTCDSYQPLAWADQLGRDRWDAVAALAVLHHIPGATQRARLLAACADLLRPGGILMASTWQFLSATRLSRRIQPWESAGLRSEDVEPGDYLLPWGENAAGQRYCAAIDEETLQRLAQAADLTPLEFFFSDGHERNLNLYGVFQKMGSSVGSEQPS